MENMYYLYRHIRLDKDQVFYVGRAKLNKNGRTLRMKFRRAYDSYARNKIWKNIKNKTDIKVEIILLHQNEETIKKKEIEFISLYRKKSEGGTLANITDGGESASGFRHTEESLSKMLKKQAELRLSNPLYGKIVKSLYVYDLKGNFLRKFLKTKECAKTLKICYFQIKRSLANTRTINDRFLFSLEELTKNEALYKIENQTIINMRAQRSKNDKILQCDDKMTTLEIFSKSGDVIKKYPTICRNHLNYCIRKKLKYYGYYWIIVD